MIPSLEHPQKHPLAAFRLSRIFFGPSKWQNKENNRFGQVPGTRQQDAVHSFDQSVMYIPEASCFSIVSLYSWLSIALHYPPAAASLTISLGKSPKALATQTHLGSRAETGHELHERQVLIAALHRKGPLPAIEREQQAAEAPDLTRSAPTKPYKCII